MQEGAEPLQCTLNLTGPADHSSALSFGCASELYSLRLFAGTQFDDATFQATLARLFVAGQLQARCR